jgi:hypothetical protein
VTAPNKGILDKVETYSVEKIEEKKRVKFQKVKDRYLAAKKEQEVIMT